MFNYTQHKATLATACISLFLAVVFAILSPCFINVDVQLLGLQLYVWFAILSGVFVLTYAIILICVQCVLKDGFGHFALSWELVIAFTVLLVLSPVGLVINFACSFHRKDKRKKVTE